MPHDKDTDRTEAAVIIVVLLILVSNVAMGVEGVRVKEHVERDCVMAQRTTRALIDLNHALIVVSQKGDPTDRAVATARAHAAITLASSIPKCD